MNDFQGGVTASDLSPQTFKNSNQTPGIQNTLDGEDIQSDNLNQSINTLPTSGKLVVVGASPSSTLGVSTDLDNQPASSTNFVPIALIAVIVFAGLAVYFLRNFKISFDSEDE